MYAIQIWPTLELNYHHRPLYVSRLSKYLDGKHLPQCFVGG